MLCFLPLWLPTTTTDDDIFVVYLLFCYLICMRDALAWLKVEALMLCCLRLLYLLQTPPFWQFFRKNLKICMWDVLADCGVNKKNEMFVSSPSSIMISLSMTVHSNFDVFSHFGSIETPINSVRNTDCFTNFSSYFTVESLDSYEKKNFFFWSLFLLLAFNTLNYSLKFMSYKIKWLVLLVIEIEKLFPFLFNHKFFFSRQFVAVKWAPAPIHHTLILKIAISNGIYTVKSCAIFIVKLSDRK